LGPTGNIKRNVGTVDPLAVCGRVHSLESFGTVDGPGTRLVVFCQGCPMRCAYCHNPDTWDFSAGTETSVAQVMDAFERNRPFYRTGGITVSGGEPLAQPEFVSAIFRAAHESPHGRVHTVLDTSGATWPSDGAPSKALDDVLDDCDMVLLDIKHADAEEHRALCGMGPAHALALGDELARRDIPTVIRHVVVPGITDGGDELAAMGRVIARWTNVVGLDLLPYHTMGVAKYQALGIPYRLEGVPPMDASRLPALRRTALLARNAHLSHDLPRQSHGDERSS